MPELVLGTVAAVTASALFSVGLLLQAIEARALEGEDGGPLAVLRRLLRRRRWLLGALVMACGFLFHAGALLLAPLTVVQPSLAAGLLVLLAYSSRTEPGEVGVQALAGVAAITVGVVALTLTGPERTTLSAATGPLVATLGVLALLALLPQVAGRFGRRRPEWIGPLAILGAGCAYSLTGLTTKLVSDRLDGGDTLGLVLWLLVTAAVAVLALLDQTTALRHRPATQVGVVIYVMPVVIPVLLAPLLLGEGWGSSPAGPVPLALSVLCVSAGAGLLGASRQVTAVEAPAGVR